MFGDDYISQHMIHEFRRDAELEVYQRYTAETLYCISTGREMSVRYSEVKVSDMDDGQTDERTAEEIKSDMKDRLNRRGKGGNS